MATVISEFHMNWIVRGEPKDPELTLGNGIKLTRHSSGMGTVWENTSVGKFLVLDPQYCAEKKFNSTTTTTGDINSRIIKGSDLGLPSIPRGSVSSSFPIDPNTSKWNCDQWMKNTDTEAVHYCRSILVDGKPCDLLNLNILKVLYDNRTDFYNFNKNIHGSNYENIFLKHIWTSTWYGKYEVYSSDSSTKSIFYCNWIAQSGHQVGTNIATTELKANMEQTNTYAYYKPIQQVSVDTITIPILEL